MEVREMEKISKAETRKNFDGSPALFESCWKQFRYYLAHCIDTPESQLDVDYWLESIASAKVNDSRSRFYIYG